MAIYHLKCGRQTWQGSTLQDASYGAQAVVLDVVRQGHKQCPLTIHHDYAHTFTRIAHTSACCEQIGGGGGLCRYATPALLDRLLAGEDSVDLGDWQAHTLYKNCSDEDQAVLWFWEVLRGYSQSQLQAVVSFVTCSPVPPAGRAFHLLVVSQCALRAAFRWVPVAFRACLL